MNKTKPVALLLVVIVFLLSFMACKKDEQTESNPSRTENNRIEIQEVLSGTVNVVSVDDKTEQREDEQHGETDTMKTKKVTVSMVDIAKVYQYFAANGKAAEADAATIEQFINENKGNPEFQSQYIIDAEVVEENGIWKLTSEESLKEIYNEQAEALLLEKMNEIGEIEIPDITLEQGGGSQ